MIEISQTLESLSIETTDNLLFRVLHSMMKKNFKNTLGQKNRIISFYDENEIPQRKYFFKFLSKICEKSSTTLPNFMLCQYLTIKLGYKQTNPLKIIIFTDVEFNGNMVNFKISNPNSLFLNYIAQKFKNSNFKINDEQTSLYVEVKNTDEAKWLDELLERDEHLKFSVCFNYDNDRLDNFKRHLNIKNSANFIRRFSALAGLFEEHFETLECNINDDFASVRNSYLKLVKLYHPDRHAGKSDNIKQTYRNKFEKIQTAYESLKPYFKEQELSIMVG